MRHHNEWVQGGALVFIVQLWIIMIIISSLNKKKTMFHVTSFSLRIIWPHPEVNICEHQLTVHRTFIYSSAIYEHSCNAHDVCLMFANKGTFIKMFQMLFNPICLKVCRPAHGEIKSVITQKLLYIRCRHTRSASLAV